MVIIWIVRDCKQSCRTSKWSRRNIDLRMSSTSIFNIQRSTQHSSSRIYLFFKINNLKFFTLVSPLFSTDKLIASHFYRINRNIGFFLVIWCCILLNTGCCCLTILQDNAYFIPISTVFTWWCPWKRIACILFIDKHVVIGTDR